MSPRVTTPPPADKPHRAPAKANLALKRTVDALRPGEREYRVYDHRLPNFGLRVASTGVKSFFIQYRHRGRQHRMYLGDTRTLEPVAAYRMARSLLAAVAEGKDPLAERREAAVAEVAIARTRRAAPTVGDVAERYLDSLTLGRSARWAKEARRLYSLHVAPVMGAMKIMDVSTPDVRALHERLHKHSAQANRVRAVVSAILSRAIADSDRPTGSVNPCDNVAPYEEHERDRYLSHTEWQQFSEAIIAERTALASTPAHDTRRAQLDAIILLCLCGGRLNAVTCRRWSDLDLEARVLRVTPPHKGTTRLYLGQATLALLGAWHTERGQESPFLFPGQSRRSGPRTARGDRDIREKQPVRPIAWVRPVWESLCARANLTDLHPHDLRRSFAVAAGDVGVSTHIIAGLLSHTVPGVTGVYAKRSDPALIQAADLVSAEIATRLQLNVADPKIIPLAVGAERRARR